MNERKFKDQFVFAVLEDLEHSNIVLSYAQAMAEMLQKGLVLLHMCPDPAAAEPRLKELQQQLITHHASLTISYMALKGKLKDAVDALPEHMGAVLFVVQARKHLLRDFAACRVAYFTVQAPYKPIQQVALTVDYRKESKEKYIWASYFARFGHHSLTAHHYHYRDEGLRYKCRANLQFMRKLYTPLGISAAEQELPRRGSYPDCALLRTSPPDLLIAVTTKEMDFLEWFAGTQEDRTLFNPSHTPVLYLNPRDDIYVLCE